MFVVPNPVPFGAGQKIMRKVNENRQRGIRWSLAEVLTTADDLCLLSHNISDLKGKTNDLDDEGRKVGLRINEVAALMRRCYKELRKPKQFRPIWRSHQIRRHTKLKIFEANVNLYGCQNWKIS